MFSGQTVLGRLCRLPLRLVPKGTVIPIVSGPAKGLPFWVAGSATHGCWAGIYDQQTQSAITKYVNPGMVCYDCGANVGFFTLLLSRCCGPTGKVFAFEPDPANLVKLERHVLMNRLANVEILPIALSDYDGVGCFRAAESQGRLAASGDCTVKCARLDSLRLPPPHFVKMDIRVRSIGDPRCRANAT